MGVNLESEMKLFEHSGYVIVEAEDKKPLIESRRMVAEFLRTKYSLAEADDETILNTIHQCIDLDDAAANQLVMSAIKDYGNHLDMSEIIFSACKSFLSSILGPDIASQKNPNIVFQYPASQRFSELHTDSPANSEYEIVAWAPLVDCYGTKSFYVVDYHETRRLLGEYENRQIMSSWNKFRDLCVASSILVEVKFGSVLFFSTSLLHGSLINTTNESRWSLNTRYKNLFAPCGLKDPFMFYKVFRSSPLTNIALGRV